MVHQLPRIEPESEDPRDPAQATPAAPGQLPAAEEGGRARVGAAPASPPERRGGSRAAVDAGGSREVPADQAVAVADHLRTTLALISGYSQTLLNLDLDDDERRHYLNGIVVAVENLSEQAEEILAIARDDGRQVPPWTRDAGPSLRLVRPVGAGPLGGRGA